MAADLQPGDLGKHDVEENEVGLHLVETIEGLGAIDGNDDFEPFAAQADRQCLDEARLVLDDENGGFSHGTPLLRDGTSRETGNRRTNVEPSPSSDDTSTSPPWFEATWRTMDSPRPVPPVSRLRALSTR